MQWAPGYKSVQFALRARWSGGKLTGELEETGMVGPRRQTNTMAVSARRVSGPPGPEDIGRSGYYSNVGAPGGELGGTEFVFIDVPDNPVGLLTFYQGSAGKPLAAQRLVVRGDTLRFQIQQPDREDAFEVILHDREMVMSSGTLGFAPERLTKRATIAKLAHGGDDGRCPD
ncbi:MAG TPA: hypothetical protein VN803_15120 [Gemmatimonadales bacterium]|nr:hypothetical protein [Gemmatimonadales bacterium]